MPASNGTRLFAVWYNVCVEKRLKNSRVRDDGLDKLYEDKEEISKLCGLAQGSGGGAAVSGGDPSADCAAPSWCNHIDARGGEALVALDSGILPPGV